MRARQVADDICCCVAAFSLTDTCEQKGKASLMVSVFSTMKMLQRHCSQLEQVDPLLLLTDTLNLLPLAGPD
jgi:hypothetical protein